MITSVEWILRTIYKNIKFIFPPKENIIHLYKKIDEGFLGIKTIYKDNNFEQVEYYDLKSGLLLDNFYSKIDQEFDYMYSLLITKIGKRDFNTFKKQYSENDENNLEEVKIKYFQKTYKSNK